MQQQTITTPHRSAVPITVTVACRTCVKIASVQMTLGSRSALMMWLCPHCTGTNHVPVSGRVTAVTKIGA